MRKLIGFFFIVFALLVRPGENWAQTPVADFTVQASACLSEGVPFGNTSTSATNYVWDFCMNDLSNASGVSLVKNISGATTPMGITMVYDQGNWYGFVTSRFGHKIFRLDFGTSIENTNPTVTDLGNVSSVLNGPKTLRFVKEGGTWYAIGTNNGTSSLFRLTFPTGLNNAPTAQNLGNLDTWSGSDGLGLDLTFDGADWIAVVTCYNNNRASLVKFGASITNNPTGSDKLTIINGEVGTPYGISLIKDAGQWYGLVASYGGNQVTRLRFGAALFSVPTRDNIYTLTTPMGVSLKKEGENYYGFITTQSGNVHRLTFGNSVNNSVASSQNLGAFGALDRSDGFDLVRGTPYWYGFFVDYSSNNVHRLKFQGTCTGPSLQTSTAINPSISYSQAGTYYTELTAYHSNGNFDVEEKVLTVQNQSAPDIDFTIDNDRCLGIENTFTSVNVSGGIQDYAWTLGDGGSASANTANHTYGITGSYSVNLTITGTNSCVNAVTKSLTIYNVPQAHFDLPAGTNCTNQSLLFNNTSTFDGGSNPSWNWFVDGSATASTEDFNHSFGSVSTYAIKLVASIPGCQTEETKNLSSLSTGPAVDYSYTNNCYLEAIEFTNLTSGGGITGQTWDFDDGTQATTVNASHTFASAGSYDVTLTVTNGSGCSNVKMVTIPVNDQPLIDFTYTSAVENVPITFSGQDLTLSDDQVTSWVWDFNALGTDNVNPSAFTFTTVATHPVKLTISTQQGCSYELQKPVVVQLATGPSASFTMSNQACLNEQIAITNTSANATSYVWDFCMNDLSSASGVVLSKSIPSASTPLGITMVYDQGNWYGFMTNRSSHTIFRLDFGSSLENTPTVTDLGNVSSILSGPKILRFVHENGTWYAIGTNNNTSSLFRLTFSSGLNNSPTGQNLGNLDSWSGADGMGLDLVNDGSNWIAIVTCYNNNRASLVKFGASVTNNPTGSDKLTILSGEVNTPYGVKLFKDVGDGQWYGLVASYGGNKVVRLRFGATLYSVPTRDDIYTTLTTPTSVSIQKEGDTYYGFVSTSGGNFHRLVFGNSLNNALSSSQNLGTFGLLDRTDAFDLVRSTPYWYGFFVDYVGKVVYRLKFQGTCTGPSLQTSTSFNPAISYSQAGTYRTELTAYHTNGNSDAEEKLLTIQNQNAPDIDFTIDSDRCLGVENTFTSVSVAGGIQDYAWTFGEGGNATTSIANYTYGSAGGYSVKLAIEGTNGCVNSVTKPITIYNLPQADFDLPSGTVCTNQSLLFNNTSTFDGGSNPSWNWFIDGVATASTEDLSHSFGSVSTYAIKLIASIPGCQTEVTKNLSSLSSGPSVDYSYTNNCYQEAIQFTNLTTGGGITGQTWDFDDGAQATTANASHTFASAGSYDVMLTVTNSSGCSNLKTLTISVNDQALIDFSYTGAVENVPITFTGQDLTLSDDQVTSWLWDFNGLGSASVNPSTFAFGSQASYPVKLTVTTLQGCDYEVQKSVLVLAATGPSASFSIVNQACLNEQVIITNTTVNASSYSWDFCMSDLSNPLGATLIKNVSAANIPMGITMVYDQGNWYGFLTSRNNQKIFRLDFGTSLENPDPVLTDLGNVGSVLNGPKTLRFVLEGGVWYAIGVNNFSSALFRLTFSSGLNNPPTAQNLGNLDGWSATEGLDLAFDGTNWIALVTSYNNNKASLVNFGTTITNNPTLSDKLTIIAGEVGTPYGIKLMKDAGQWYGLLSSYGGNKITRLRFGTTLFSVPTREDIYVLTTPTSVSMQKEGSNYYAFITTASGNLHRLLIGNSLNDPIVGSQNLGKFNSLDHTEGFDLVRSSPFWYGFFVDYTEKNIHRIKFESTCNQISVQYPTANNPKVTYAQSGNFMVELTAYSGNGNYDVITKSIAIQTETSPDIDFVIDGQCLQTPISFTAVSNLGGIQDYTWNFDDGNSATGNLSSHLYNATGSYSIELSILATNGCSNKTIKNLSIYNIPDANFTLPTGTLCTNQLLPFTNSSTFDAASNPIWQWSVDNVIVSNTTDLQRAFSDPSPKTIKLAASILGCSDEHSESLNTLQSGPQVDFNFSSACQYDQISFSNTTSGSVLDYLWSFGDSQSSTGLSPVHAYTLVGNYSVTLQANSPNGCQNTNTKVLSIHSKPQPNLSTPLPPFSCNGSPTQFNDDTPGMTDSNVVTWHWNFGDPEALGDTAVIKNPQYTFAKAGTYDVSLNVTTNYGCSTLIQKSITISPSPSAEFSYTPACDKSPVTFSTAPEAGIASWNWQVGETFFSFSNPTYTFPFPGDYTVSLTATSANNCLAYVEKTIRVQDPVYPYFTVEKNCVGYPAIFLDETETEDDVVSRTWTFGGSDIAVGSPVTHVFSKSQDYDVKLKITTLSGCVYEVTDPVSIAKAPKAFYTVNQETGAPPLISQFTNESKDASTYLWTFNDKSNTTSTASVPQFTFQEYGDYVVDLTATNAQKCSHTFSRILSVIHPAINVSLTSFVTGENPDGTISTLLTLENRSNVMVQNMNLLLDISGIKIKEVIPGPILPDATLMYSPKLGIFKSQRIDYLCASIDMAGEIDLSDNQLCASLEKEIVFEPYPNPSSENIIVEWITGENEQTRIQVVDVMGHQKLSAEYASSSGFNRIMVNLEGIGSGVYFLLFDSENTHKNYRFVVNH